MALISRISARRDRERMDSLVLLGVLVTGIGLGLTATGSRGLPERPCSCECHCAAPIPDKGFTWKDLAVTVLWRLSCALAWD